jgi:hypothetical protein
VSEMEIGPGERIRTSDLRAPNALLFLAELHPVRGRQSRRKLTNVWVAVER